MTYSEQHGWCSSSISSVSHPSNVDTSTEPCPILTSSLTSTSLIFNSNITPISNESISSLSYGKRKNASTLITRLSLDHSNEYHTTKRIEELHERMDDIQVSNFLKFINYHLSQKYKNGTRQINDIGKDLSDGHALIDLIEILSSTKLRREFGRTRFHSLTNVRHVLDYLKSRIQHVNICPHEIVSGNRKQILALLWIIMKTFDFPGFRLTNKNCFVENTLIGYGQDRSFIVKWLNNIISQYLHVQKLYVENFYLETWINGYYFSIIVKYLVPLSMRYFTKKCFDYLQELNDITNYDKQCFQLCLNISNYCFYTNTDIDYKDKSEKCLFRYFTELQKNIFVMLKTSSIGKLTYDNPYAKQILNTVIETQTTSEHFSHIMNNNEQYLMCVEEDSQQEISTGIHTNLSIDSTGHSTSSSSSSDDNDEFLNLRTVEKSRPFKNGHDSLKVKRKNRWEKNDNNLQSNLNDFNDYDKIQNDKRSPATVNLPVFNNDVIGKFDENEFSYKNCQQDINDHIELSQSIDQTEQSTLINNYEEKHLDTLTKLDQNSTLTDEEQNLRSKLNEDIQHKIKANIGSAEDSKTHSVTIECETCSLSNDGSQILTSTNFQMNEYNLDNNALINTKQLEQSIHTNEQVIHEETKSLINEIEEQENSLISEKIEQATTGLHEEDGLLTDGEREVEAKKNTESEESNENNEQQSIILVNEMTGQHIENEHPLATNTESTFLVPHNSNMDGTHAEIRTYVSENHENIQTTLNEVEEQQPILSNIEDGKAISTKDHSIESFVPTNDQSLQAPSNPKDIEQTESVIKTNLSESEDTLGKILNPQAILNNEVNQEFFEEEKYIQQIENEQLSVRNEIFPEAKLNNQGVKEIESKTIDSQNEKQILKAEPEPCVVLHENLKVKQIDKTNNDASIESRENFEKPTRTRNRSDKSLQSALINTISQSKLTLTKTTAQTNQAPRENSSSTIEKKSGKITDINRTSMNSFQSNQDANKITPKEQKHSIYNPTILESASCVVTSVAPVPTMTTSNASKYSEIVSKKTEKELSKTKQTVIRVDKRQDSNLLKNTGASSIASIEKFQQSNEKQTMVPKESIKISNETPISDEDQARSIKPNQDSSVSTDVNAVIKEPATKTKKAKRTNAKKNKSNNSLIENSNSIEINNNTVKTNNNDLEHDEQSIEPPINVPLETSNPCVVSKIPSSNDATSDKNENSQNSNGLPSRRKKKKSKASMKSASLIEKPSSSTSMSTAENLNSLSILRSFINNRQVLSLKYLFILFCVCFSIIIIVIFSHK